MRDGAGYTLHIPRWHPCTVNQLYAGHWARRARLKKADRDVVRLYGSLSNIPPAETARRVGLTVILRPGRRAPDPDAFTKSLADALVLSGLLVNDSPKWVEHEPVRYERGTAADWGSRITLTDLRGG